MSFARLSCLRSLPTVSGLQPMLTHGAPALRGSTLKPLLKPYQEYPTKVRSGFFQWQPTRDLFKEAALEPASTTAIRISNVGRMMVAGGAAVGLGTLYYYGMGMSSEICAIEKAASWPQYVKDRVQSTYMYFAGSVGLTALSAAAVSRSSFLMDLMTRSPWMAFGASCAAIMGAIKLVRSISYEDSSKSKHVAWMIHAGVMGAVLAPLTLLGGPLMTRAAWYTAGIVGGLSTVAMCAPSERFLYMGGPLAAGLGVVFASSLASMFLAPTSAIGAGFYSVAVYGGLLLCSGFLLNDTQEVIKRAEETCPKKQKYDPINECMGIYTDTFLHNIFVSLFSILADRM